MRHPRAMRGVAVVGPIIAMVASPGLANVAATALVLLGYAPPGDYEPSLIRLRS